VKKGKLREVLAARRAPGASVFHPTVFHDLGPRPILIESEAQLKRICEERGLYSVHLENKGTKISPRNPRRRVVRYDKKSGKVVEVKRNGRRS